MSHVLSPAKKKLLHFLNYRKIEKGEPFTHTSIYDPKIKQGLAGAYNIKTCDTDEFYSLYNKVVFKGKEPMHLTEKHDMHSPVLIDLDFRFAKSDNFSRKYTQETVKIFLINVMKELNKFIKFDVGDDNIKRQAFVFEKSRPVAKEEFIKDGIHIIFPYIVTCPEVQFMIRNELLKTCDYLVEELELINPIGDVIDEAVIYKNNWQMYGSCKPGCKPYKLTHIYTIQNLFAEEVSDDEFNKWKKDPLKLCKLLSIREKPLESELKVEAKLKIQSYKQKNEKAEQLKLNKTKKHTRGRKKQSANTFEKIDLARALVGILDEERADAHNSWISVGWCLHNIDYRLLENWILFSKKSDKYKNTCEKECTELWDTFQDKGLHFGTLCHWAKNDDEYKFDEIMATDIRTVLTDSLNVNEKDISTYNIAKVAKYIFKNKYVCASIKHKIWYQFRDHRWQEIDCGVNLRNDLSEILSYEYSRFKLFHQSHATSSEADPNKERVANLIKKAGSISNKLREVEFKNKIMREAMDAFVDSKFVNNLDCNNDLIGFENGVYDLGLMEFREGRPEDYISLSTGIEYIEYDDDDEVVQEIYEFFKQVLPIKRVRKYVLKLLASFMNGSVKDEKFHIWTGSGGNGKSKVIELFQNALGQYCCTLPHTIITRKKQASGSAAPELFNAKGRRLAALNEPDDNEKIMVGSMKEMSGGDKIQVRGLYRDPVEFKPQFKMLLLCNHLPSMPSEDEGTWRRVRLVEFSSVFTHNPDPEKPHEFPIDVELTEKMKDWSEPFIHILIKYYAKYKKEGLKEPPEVTKCTDSYRLRNDIYSEFLREFVEECPNGVLRIDDLSKNFNDWFKNSYSYMKCPNRKDLIAYMNKRHGEIKGLGKVTGWTGLRLAQEKVSILGNAIIADEENNENNDDTKKLKNKEIDKKSKKKDVKSDSDSDSEDEYNEDDLVSADAEEEEEEQIKKNNKSKKPIKVIDTEKDKESDSEEEDNSI